MTAPTPAPDSSRPPSNVLRWVLGGAFVLVIAAFIGALVVGARNPRFAAPPEPGTAPAGRPSVDR